MAKKSQHNPKTDRTKTRNKKQDEERILYLAGLLEQISDAVISTDMEFRVLEWNAAAEVVYGWSADEVTGHPVRDFVQTEYLNTTRDEIIKMVLEKGVWRGEVTQVRKDGTRFPVLASVSLVKDLTGVSIGFVTINRDITERVRAEKQVVQMKRLYATLSQVNQTIVRVKDSQELYQSICDVSVKFGEFALAWIGTIDPETGDITPVALRGVDIDQLPFSKIDLRQKEFKNGLAATALRTSSVVTTDDTALDERTAAIKAYFEKHDYHSAAAVPFQLEGISIGVLILVSREKGLFVAEEEVLLLKEMGGDISFALDTIESETKRRRAEEKIERQNHRLKVLREIDLAILSAETLENIVGAALDHIRDLIGCRRANLTLIDRGTNELVIFGVSMVGETSIPVGQRLPLAQFENIIEPLSQNQPVLISDLRSLTNPNPGVQRLLGEGLRSTCSLPLFSQGSLMGMLSMHSETPGFFDDEKIALGREVANQVAIAITQIRLIEALAKNEERLRLSLHAARQGLYDLNVQTGEAIVNREYAEMLGYDPDTFVETHAAWVGRMHPDDQAVTAKVYEDYVNGLLPEYRVEFRQRTKQGDWKWLLSLGSIVEYDSEGKPLRMLGTHTDIDELKRAEESQVEAYAKLEKLFEILPVGISVLDRENKVVRQNPALERILDITAEGIARGDYLKRQYIRPDGSPMPASEFASMRVIKGEPSVSNVEIGVVREDQSVIWTKVSAVAVPFSDWSTLIVTTDVTEEKQREKVIRQWADAFENCAHGIALGLPSTDQILTCNTAFARLQGYSIEEISSMPILNMYAPQDHEHVKRSIAEADRTGFVRYEANMIRKDGSSYLVQMDVVSVRDVNGNLLYRVATQQDITERRRSEISIRLAEQQYRLLFEESPVMVVLTENKNMNILIERCNQQFLSTLGYDQEEVIGKSLIDVYSPDSKVKLEQSYRQTLMGIPLSEERGLVARDGRIIPVLLKAVPRTNAEGVVIGTQACYIDISERKQAEEDTQRQLQRMRALQEIDQSIIGGVDLKLSLRIVLDQLLLLLNVDAADILLLTPATQMLNYAEGRGFRSKGIEASNLRVGQGVAGHVALEQVLQFIPELSEIGAEFVRANLVAGEDFVSYCAVPLVAKGNTVGVLEVFSRKPLKQSSSWVEFLNALAGQAAIAIDNNRLFTSLQRANVDLMLAYDNTIEGWSQAMDLRDKETEGHTLRVMEMTMKLSQLAGISEELQVHVRRGALLHDIGKMGIPDAILLKPGNLTEEEWVVMRKHPVYAFELLSNIDYLRPAMDIPYCHHERWDGTGYPRGLKGEQIPLVARLFAVVDVWDALTSDRPYREGWSKERTLDHIRARSGSHFDPKAVELFLKMMGEST